MRLLWGAEEGCGVKPTQLDIGRPCARDLAGRLIIWGIAAKFPPSRTSKLQNRFNIQDIVHTTLVQPRGPLQPPLVSSWESFPHSPLILSRLIPQTHK